MSEERRRREAESRRIRERSDRRKTVAVFRHWVISPLRLETRGTKAWRERLRELSARKWAIPGSERTRIAPQTIRDWFRRYEEEGLDGLKPKRRRDRGTTRRLRPETIEALLEIKRASPASSVPRVIRTARAEGRVPQAEPLSRSTVYRLFRNEGLMDPAAAGPSVERRKFGYEFAGELWMSDVLHGPRVPDGSRKGVKRKTYLILFLDDATRVVPYAEFRFSEDTANFLQVFRGALERRGKPDRLYVDNGSAYRSLHTRLVCAKLDVSLTYARAQDPAGKGKIERFFRTVRGSFLTHLDAEGTRDLDTLNRRFHVWVEREYHRSPHGGIGVTPLEKWAMTGGEVKYFDPALDLDALFLLEEERRVYKDQTVRLRNRFYEVDAHLVGKRVVLHVDPKAPPQRPIRVTLDGRDAGFATPVDLAANARRRRKKPPSPGISFSRDDDPSDGDA